jgi:hypothetical protein
MLKEKNNMAIPKTTHISQSGETYDIYVDIPTENGKIDNGGELFGNHTLVGNEKAADGFAA